MKKTLFILLFIAAMLALGLRTVNHNLRAQQIKKHAITNGDVILERDRYNKTMEPTDANKADPVITTNADAITTDIKMTIEEPASADRSTEAQPLKVASPSVTGSSAPVDNTPKPQPLNPLTDSDPVKLQKLNDATDDPHLQFTN